MMFIAIKRFDADGNDLMPSGAEHSDIAYLSHIELAPTAEGVPMETEDTVSLLESPLVAKMVDDLIMLDELEAAIIADGVTA